MNRTIRHQRGAVAIIVALSLALLLAMIGLAIDLGRMFVIKTELQNAADACALAASKELNGFSGAKIRADSAGKAVGEHNLIFFQYLGQDPEKRLSIDPVKDIRYSETLDGNYNRSITDDKAKFVKCELTRPDIPMLFMGVKGLGISGFGPQTVKAMAVASLVPSQSPCVLPLALCMNKTPPTDCSAVGGSASDSPDANGLCVGEWRSGKFESPINGAFNWLDFENDGIEGNIKEQLITGYCGQIPGETVKGQTGNQESASVYWNTRFALYKSGNNPQYNDTPPATSDQTGYAYTPTNWTTKFGAYSQFLTHRPPRDTFQGNASTGLDIKVPPYLENKMAPALAVGTPDRRVVVVPVVDCTGWSPTHVVTLTPNLACVLLLHPMGDKDEDVYMEYLGVAGTPGSPCPSFGLPGGSSGGYAKVPGLVQ